MRIKVTYSVHWVRVSPTPIATDYLIEVKRLTKCRIDKKAFQNFIDQNTDPVLNISTINVKFF